MMRAGRWFYGVAACAAIGSAVAADFIPPGAKFDAASEMGAPGSGGDPLIGEAFEKGELDGVRFYIYANGRAHYSGWDFFCRSDTMTDERSCTIKQGDVWVMVSKTGVDGIIVGYKHHPGKPVMLRLDGAAPLTSKSFGWSGKEAAQIVASASQAKVINTRYTRWPDSAPTDGTTPGGGLAGAVRIAQWMVSQKPAN